MSSANINLLKGDKHGSETDYRDALPVNMYGVEKQIGNAAGYMVEHEGLDLIAEAVGSDRGAIWNERFNEHYRISGTRLVKINTDDSVTNIGEIIGSGIAALPYSFNTQGIIADGNFYLYSPTSGLSQVTDADLGSPIDGVWVNGVYFMTDGEYLFHTDIANEASIDPLKFATAEFMPDPSYGVAKTSDNKVMVFGRYTTEFFVDQASDNFAYRRIESRAIKAGIVGTHAKAELSEKWYILGGAKESSVSVYIIGVGSMAKVASREIDKIISKYNETELRNAIVESRSKDGLSLVVVHLPNETLLFNESLFSKFGAERSWSIVSTASGVWDGIHGVFDAYRGKWVYGSKSTSKVGELTDGTNLTFGEVSEWLLYTPFLYLDSASIDELEIKTISGFTASKDATVFVSLSYDGVMYGREWTEMYGLPSDYQARFILYMLGQVPDKVSLKFRGKSSSRMAFSECKINYG